MKPGFLIGVACFTLFNYEANPRINERVSQIVIKTNKMKEFSFMVRVPLFYSREQVNAANPKWNSLLDKWKADGIYMISFAFPGDGWVVAGKDGLAKKETIVCDNLKVVSNIFLRAENMESATELAKSFPVLEYGGTVEIREIPPKPAPAN